MEVRGVGFCVWGPEGGPFVGLGPRGRGQRSVAGVDCVAEGFPESLDDFFVGDGGVDQAVVLDFLEYFVGPDLLGVGGRRLGSVDGLLDGLG